MERHGMARKCRAWNEKEWHVMTWKGKARQDMAMTWHAMAWKVLTLAWK
jgi:hypothetical protein